MSWSLAFVVNSILLGVGLAMDAFSVSMANGLNEPNMKKRKMLGIAGTFGAVPRLVESAPDRRSGNVKLRRDRPVGRRLSTRRAL